VQSRYQNFVAYRIKWIVGQALIGTSGWNYKHWWNGVFYSKNLRPNTWLPYFAGQFDTVEINNSFYRLPTEETFKSWRDQVPDRFVFAVKASRFLTHIKRLKDPAEPIDLFFSRAKHLRESLGPVLFQLPPKFKCDLERLEIFLRALRAHPVGKRSRNVLEVRDVTWLTRRVYDVLERFNVCLCFADWRDLQIEAPVTAGYVYVRRHYGKGRDGNYSRPELDRDVRQIHDWLDQKLDVFMYFNNDWKGYAVKNARYVKEQLSGSVRR